MYKFQLPTIIYHEDNCIKNNNEIFNKCGKKAMIVTGRYSAKACGALDDITSVLEEEKISYVIFNEVENNPSIETVEKASISAKDFGADFVIGIGGGSPIDAAKAIAVLAVNEITGEELFNNQFENVLPIIAIPTTAGTGTEVTPYSVLINNKKNSKFSFGSNKTFPKYALLDVKYMESLKRNILLNTAVDAFTHSAEGFLCNKANPMSDTLAVQGIKIFGESLNELKSKEISKETKNKLLFASTLGGSVIAHTGVTIVHGMGYCYTYYKDIPHGVANGLLLPILMEYLKEERKDKIKVLLECLNCADISEFKTLLCQLIGEPPELSEEEIELYTEQSMLQMGSVKNTPTSINEEIIEEFWRKTL